MHAQSIMEDGPMLRHAAVKSFKRDVKSEVSRALVQQLVQPVVHVPRCAAVDDQPSPSGYSVGGFPQRGEGDGGGVSFAVRADRGSAALEEDVAAARPGSQVSATKALATRESSAASKDLLRYVGKPLEYMTKLSFPVATLFAGLLCGYGPLCKAGVLAEASRRP